MASKWTIRGPRRVWLAVALIAIVGILLVAQNSTVLVPDVASYTVVDQRTIAMRVAVAPCSWTRVTGVAETSAEVRVTVETWPCPLPFASTAALAMRDLSVSLAADLASRSVQDASGQAVPPR
jgi:hypothetical protein